MDANVVEIITGLTNASAGMLMVIFIVAIFKSLIIPKSNYDKLVELWEKRYTDLEEVCDRQQREILEWKTAALRSLEVTRQVVPAAIDKASSGQPTTEKAS